MPEANLVGGSERDRAQILQLHADYIDANARFEIQKGFRSAPRTPDPAIGMLNMRQCDVRTAIAC